jgi:hypothetical protein
MDTTHVSFGKSEDGDDTMSQDDTWSPDEPPGSEAFEEGDEARDEQSRIDAEFFEDVELDPSLDPTLLLDERELEEAGAEFDNPEKIATLDGGIDDPDGIDDPSVRRSLRDDDEGYGIDGPALDDDEPV